MSTQFAPPDIGAVDLPSALFSELLCDDAVRWQERLVIEGVSYFSSSLRSTRALIAKGGDTWNRLTRTHVPTIVVIFGRLRSTLRR